MKRLPFLAACALLASSAFAAVEEPVDHRFKAFTPDPAISDWQGTGAYVAQVTLDEHGDYQANLLSKFDAENNVVATLRGQNRGEGISLKGGGWSGKIADGHFTAHKGDEQLDLKPIKRPSPTLGAEPPKGAVVLFDGKSLDAWAKKSGKDWLTEDGPGKWKLVEGGAVEVVPAADSLISHQKFGDCRVHVEFRTLGAPTNSGVYLETRYEVNINETYGALEGTPNAGLDNCTPKTAKPKIRASRPPLEWQTLDIDFKAPRFDAAGNKTAAALATVRLNGVELYHDQELNLPTGAAGRLGEAPTGPVMLQEHGMPAQFRNIWVLPAKS
jgi:hypothetical protein